MTEEEILAIIGKMEELYGDNVANYIHEPVRFAHQIKIARYKMSRMPPPVPEVFTYSTEGT